MAHHATRPWTVEEFIAWEDGTDRRYELVDGAVVAMAPPTEAHATVVGNLTVRIGSQLRPPCRVLNEAGVARPDRTESYLQPDLLVTCAAPERGRQTPPEPVLIAEVLSPSTEPYDRARKLDAYCQIDSVQEVLLIWSEERRVQHWKRAGTQWTVDNLIASADLRLDLLSEPISLDTIYRGSGL